MDLSFSGFNNNGIVISYVAMLPSRDSFGTNYSPNAACGGRIFGKMMEVMPRCFVAMTMFLRLACFGECTGISFVDSTCIPVIHNKRQFNMKVFKDIAAKGKNTMG